MSQSAFDRLGPAFPQRAPWGTATKLRAWQQEALDLYLSSAPRDFLAVATPGAGKTTFALRVASELLHARVVRRVIVVQAAMPAAMFPLVIARLYGGQPLVAAQIILATTILGILAIPLWIAFGLHWTGV